MGQARKPVIEKGRGRKAVREVLYEASGYWRNLRILSDGIERLTGTQPDDSQILQWIEWNTAEGHVEHRRDTEYDEDQWKITRHGIAEEEL